MSGLNCPSEFRFGGRNGCAVPRLNQAITPNPNFRLTLDAAAPLMRFQNFPDFASPRLHRDHLRRSAVDLRVRRTHFRRAITRTNVFYPLNDDTRRRYSDYLIGQAKGLF